MTPHEYVILEIARERERQIEQEGWTPEHDDGHVSGEIAQAAACYALPRPEMGGFVNIPRLWPWSWSHQWWKPKDRRGDLIRAAALIVAEIERLDRAAAAPADDGFDAPPADVTREGGE